MTYDERYFKRRNRFSKKYNTQTISTSVDDIVLQFQLVIIDQLKLKNYNYDQLKCL